MKTFFLMLLSSFDLQNIWLLVAQLHKPKSNFEKKNVAIVLKKQVKLFPSPLIMNHWAVPQCSWDMWSDLGMFCCLSPPFRISMSSDFPHYSFRMPNIGFQNLPLNIYIVVFGTAIFVFILSLLFCCYLIRYDQYFLPLWSSFVFLHNALSFMICLTCILFKSCFVPQKYICYALHSQCVTYCHCIE